MRFIEMYEVNYNGKRSIKVLGLWKDAIGNDNIVSFKNSWGSHEFSDKEVEALLEGREITFNSITGHLQYRMLDDEKKYFGFCAKSFYKEYDRAPVFNPNVGSRYEIDRRNEAKMNQFMRLHYYSRLKNADGTKVQCEFISDKARQTQGIDVIYSRNDRKYVVDEKAQIDYIYEGPLNTFVLELLNGSSGRVGWFINDELKTEYYMFIWPHADIQYTDKQLRNVNDIEYARYALVERTRLKKKIESQYPSADRLMDYAMRLLGGTLEGAYEKNNRRYFKKPPFDRDVYLVYTMPPTHGTNESGKVEQPVNLVVSKKLIEEVAEAGETGTLRRNDKETNGGIN